MSLTVSLVRSKIRVARIREISQPQCPTRSGVTTEGKWSSPLKSTCRAEEADMRCTGDAHVLTWKTDHLPERHGASTRTAI